MAKKNKVIMINSKDNVMVALSDIAVGEMIELGDIKIRTLSDIPFGHKIAAKDLKEGDIIIKYGEVIGLATTDIRKGEWIHCHNIHGRY